MLISNNIYILKLFYNETQSSLPAAFPLGGLTDTLTETFFYIVASSYQDS